jgi:zinc transport system substrate-binding protein
MSMAMSMTMAMAMKTEAVEMGDLRFRRRRCGARGFLAGLALLALPVLPAIGSLAAFPGRGMASPPPAAPSRTTLAIGVTLHPYYSWTRNVVGDLPGFEVRPILPGEIDAGDYQPRPEDIRKLADLDALVVNGIGHDDFIFPMLRASGNRRAVVIRPNDATPQIRSAHGTAVNSHTFISFTNAVQQTYAIEKALAALRPAAAPALQRNAEAYARRLRLIKARAAAKLADATITRVVTVHDGYGYLLQEFGLEVAGVVQPAHGLTPSAAELRDMIELLRRERIRVVFSEESFPPRLLAVLRGETGVRVYTISHIASGAYTADKFEQEMQRNVDTMVEALVTAPRRAASPHG